MRFVAACIAVAATFTAALAVALGVRALVPLLDGRWRWVTWVGDWLLERRRERRKR